MNREETLNERDMQDYRKLYFVWYFDDEEGYGIEVFGERIAEADVPIGTKNSLFVSVVNWSFGHGTEARDLRRAWGAYAANETKKNSGVMPLEIRSLQLRFDLERKQIIGEPEKMQDLLGKSG